MVPKTRAEGVGEGVADFDERSSIEAALLDLKTVVSGQIRQLHAVLREIDGRIERLNAPWEDWALTYENVKSGDIPYDLAMRVLRGRDKEKTPTNARVILGLIADNGPLSLKDIRQRLEALGHRLSKASNPAKAVWNEVDGIRKDGLMCRGDDDLWHLTDLGRSSLGL